MKLPKPFEPVLAYISHVNSLGTSHWYEVVYHSGKDFDSFAGSRTFFDGEVVLKWRYCEDCFNEEELQQTLRSKSC